MSFASPAFTILRRSVSGREGEWVKMFDPPKASPNLPEALTPNNPVPQEMFELNLQNSPSRPNTVQRDLLDGLTLPTWNGGSLNFMTISDKDNPSTAGGTYPAATIRIPRGKIFHCETQGNGGAPHTIHWHGIEPTAINDGVGHCSMEIGGYIYQFQPNFMGTYFYHCHRNTVQHFEFGLYGGLIIEPPNWAPRTNPVKRVACNLRNFPQFPGFNSNPLTSGDPFAMTAPYDVEVLWVPDDRDSNWSNLASSPAATFPKAGGNPGVDDDFRANDGGFFAFNDFNADYWFVTGIPVPAVRGPNSSASIGSNLIVPPALNSGVVGTRVDIAGAVGQTILVRCINAAYNNIRVKFPVDVVIIAWDGRALGVPPHARYNAPFLLPANTPIAFSVARRFDALIRGTTPINSFATIEFFDTRSPTYLGGPRNMEARIPVVIS